MNWDRLQDGWTQLKRRLGQRWARRVREKQLAEWLARRHQTDPIHK